MFVKIYEYYIEENKEACFLAIQERAVKIYRQHLNCDVMYLKSLDHENLWLEISKYSSKEEYLSAIQNVNKEPAIQELYEQFEHCLISQKHGIKESNFIMKLTI